MAKLKKELEDLEPVKPVKKAEPVLDKYVSKIRLHNPYQNVTLHDMPQTLPGIDSFWLSQIEAGLVSKI